jgi:hypothetical protein
MSADDFDARLAFQAGYRPQQGFAKKRRGGKSEKGQNRLYKQPKMLLDNPAL